MLARAYRVTDRLDAMNRQFSDEKRRRLRRLDQMSERYLEWLMVEHYQFSKRNPAFLAAAAEATRGFEDPAVAIELDRNFNEERTHAAMYREALRAIGTDVMRRVEFPPTTEFLNQVAQLSSGPPARTLGAMYATETAAIFEHQVFWEISREVVARRVLRWEDTALKAFHDLHLDGVEQSHKDGLSELVERAAARRRGEVAQGAIEAVEAMERWWNQLLGRLR